MSTPESKIKRRISALLKEFMPELYYFMPVPGGYGESTLDYIGCMNGYFFAIEAKRPGGKPTARQQTIINMMLNASAEVFVIDDEFGLIALGAWLRRKQ